MEASERQTQVSVELFVNSGVPRGGLGWVGSSNGEPSLHLANAPSSSELVMALLPMSYFHKIAPSHSEFRRSTQITAVEQHKLNYAFSALTLLVWRHEEQPACKN